MTAGDDDIRTNIKSFDAPEAAADTFVTIEAENAYVPLLPVDRGIGADTDVFPVFKALLVNVELIFET
jgi:hypothetical protein